MHFNASSDHILMLCNPEKVWNIYVVEVKERGTEQKSFWTGLRF